MPKPVNDIALAVSRSPPRAVAGTVWKRPRRATATSAASETRKIVVILVSGCGSATAGADEDRTCCGCGGCAAI